MAFAKAGGPGRPRRHPVLLGLVQPVHRADAVSAFVAGLGASIFSFWGWDTALTVNEESKDSDKTPGPGGAAVCGVDPADLPAGVDLRPDVRRRRHRGAGLGNEEIAGQRFGALAEPVMGSPWHNLLFLAVLASSRGQPDDDVPADHPDHARHGDLPGAAGAIRQHPPEVPDARLQHVVAGVSRGRSTRCCSSCPKPVLIDTILSLGLMICFYYGLTAIGCVWYLPRRAVHQLQRRHLQIPATAAGRAGPVVRLLRDAQGQRQSGLRRQRGRTSSAWVSCSSSASG